MKQKNQKLAYGIVGVGRFGRALALELSRSGCEIIVLDRDEEKIREMREITENAYVVRNLEKNTMLETGIQNCDVAIVCIGEHLDTSILTTLNLVSMKIPTVIAKAQSAEHGEILEKLGAEVVYPERDMAIRLASRLENSRMLDFVQLSETINVTKMKVPDSLVGKTVAEVNLRSRFGLNILAVEKKGMVSDAIRPDYVFCAEDILYLCGHRDGLKHMTEWSGK